MSLNIGLTLFAVRRWAARQNHSGPDFAIHRMMDLWLPDDFMELLFVNLRFIKADKQIPLP